MKGIKMHIGYSFKKPTWPKGTECIIEKTDYYEAVTEFTENLFWNTLKIPKELKEIQENYIIEKVYER